MSAGRPRDSEGGGEQDMVALYLADIGQHPLITKEDEYDLWKSVYAGQQAEAKLEVDTEHTRTIRTLGVVGVHYSAGYRSELQSAVNDGADAKETFMNSNLRLVVSVARKYQGSGLPLLDLVQEGNIGLIRAVDKFDARKGFKFSTYATWWIRQAVTRGIHNTNRLVRLPTQVEEQVSNAHKARERLLKQGNHNPTDEDLSVESGLTPERIKELVGIELQFGETYSLDEPLTSDSDFSLRDTLPSQGFYQPEEHIEQMSDNQQLSELFSECIRMEIITERDVQVLGWRFGLDGEPMTLDQIGERIGVTRERVRQIERGAVERIRQYKKIKAEPYKHKPGRRAS